MSHTRLKFWGWGHEDQTLFEAQAHDNAARIGGLTCLSPQGYTAPPTLDEISLAQTTPGRELAQWKEIKQAASEALIGEGGTIPHHHVVGRYHMPWYGAERPALMGEALSAVKAWLDPSGMFDPGVIVPHRQ